MEVHIMLQNRNEVLDELLDTMENDQDDASSFQDYLYDVFGREDRNIDHKKAVADTNAFVNDPEMDCYEVGNGSYGAIKLAQVSELNPDSLDLDPCNIANRIDLLRAQSVLSDVLEEIYLDLDDHMTIENVDNALKEIKDELN